MSANRRRRVALSTGAGFLVIAAAAVAAPKSGGYKGTTSQNQPLTFKVSSQGKSVKDFQPTLLETCTKRHKPTQQVVIPTDPGAAFPIRQDKFSYQVRHARIHNGNTVYTSNARFAAAGTFGTPHSATGTTSLNFTFNKSAPGGLGGYHCDSGTVHWTAHRI